jgi:hypothetical protein
VRRLIRADARKDGCTRAQTRRLVHFANYAMHDGTNAIISHRKDNETVLVPVTELLNEEA